MFSLSLKLLDRFDLVFKYCVNCLILVISKGNLFCLKAFSKHAHNASIVRSCMLWTWFVLTLKYNYGLVDIFWCDCLNHLGSQNFFWMLLQIFTISIRLISNWKTISLMEYRLICVFEISLVPHSLYIAIILRTKSEKMIQNVTLLPMKNSFSFKAYLFKSFKTHILPVLEEKVSSAMFRDWATFLCVFGFFLFSLIARAADISKYNRPPGFILLDSFSRLYLLYSFTWSQKLPQSGPVRWKTKV